MNMFSTMMHNLGVYVYYLAKYHCTVDMAAREKNEKDLKEKGTIA